MAALVRFTIEASRLRHSAAMWGVTEYMRAFAIMKPRYTQLARSLRRRVLSPSPYCRKVPPHEETQFHPGRLARGGHVAVPRAPDAGAEDRRQNTEDHP